MLIMSPALQLPDCLGLLSENSCLGNFFLGMGNFLGLGKFESHQQLYYYYYYSCFVWL